MPGYVSNQQTLRALGYQQIVGVAAATGLTIPAGASIAVVNVEAQAVRYRDDGTNPTATIGMPIAVGTTLVYDSASLPVLKFIESVAGATINVAYYG